MQLVLAGKRWIYRRVAGLIKSLKCRGECDPPNKKKKEIRIDASLSGEEELEVNLHEMLHAIDWTKDETWIEQSASELARALTKLGYRKME